MKQIRRGVFETNSSSSHSISVSHGAPLESCRMCADEDGFIHAKLGEFGWEIEDYADQSTKLAYLLTMTAHKNGMYPWCSNEEELKQGIAELMETEDFAEISNTVAQYAGCEGVIIDQGEGYIDHQSTEDYSSMKDFLDQNGTDILEFIFGGVVVHTDNDNH